MSLAYVFWHCRGNSASQEGYTAALAKFHETLKANPPPGFLESRVFRLASVPWLSSEAEVYEDWYLLADSAAIDWLNMTAVTEPSLSPHDAVARMAAGGVGGLYRLRSGHLGPYARPPRFACWFAKPRGDTYDAFCGRLDALALPVLALWGRQMVLGPTPEFCLHAPEPIDVPGISGSLSFDLEPVWGKELIDSAHEDLR